MDLRSVASMFQNEPVTTVLFLVLITAALVGAVVALFVAIDAARDRLREKDRASSVPRSLRYRYARRG